ncbi:hypothetical protein [Saccharothrix sp. HUAS TT1]|uniref:hypothetical protein n=1 Tax=unclassified Saccharothrix TaxID=2593673 RepID=UPI00345B7A04
MESALRLAGFDVAVAGSGRTCLDAVVDADLVLLDVMRSHPDGFELVRLLRSRQVQHQ